jgi:hypothetical protein
MRGGALRACSASICDRPKQEPVADQSGSHQHRWHLEVQQGGAQLVNSGWISTGAGSRADLSVAAQSIKNDSGRIVAGCDVIMTTS